MIILTSNLGSAPGEEGRTAGFGAIEDNSKVEAREEKALKTAFRPEFLNRIDDIIRFSRLQPDDITQITRLMLDDLCQRVAKDGITLEFGEDVVAYLAEVGYSPLHGARPLRRAIVRLVEDSLSIALLEGPRPRGRQGKGTDRQ